MKIQWLEEMVDDGLITEKTASAIYRDCEEIVKAASWPGFKDTWKQIFTPDTVSKIMDGTIAGATGVVGGVLATKYFNSREADKVSKKILQNREEIVKEMPKDDSQKVRARFNEMAVIAPNVAADKNLAKRVISGKINSGFTSQDAQGLATIQSSYSSANPKIQQKMEKALTQEKVGHITYDLYKICSETGMFKQAAGMFPRKGDFLKYVAALTAATSIPALISAGAGTVKHFYGKKQQDKMKEDMDNAFNEAITISDPDKEPLQANKDKARQAFQALAHFAPHVAMQPQAARAFMSKMVAYDQGLLTGDLKDLTQIESNIRASQAPSNFAQGFQAASKTLGMGQMAQKGVERAMGSEAPEEKAKYDFTYQQAMTDLKRDAAAAGLKEGS